MRVPVRRPPRCDARTFTSARPRLLRRRPAFRQAGEALRDDRAGAKIELKRAGKRVTSLTAGRYLFVVSDRSAVDNFHLTGPGVNRKTAVAAKGTVRWTLRLKKGRHVYRSDAHAKVRRGFAVKQAG